MHSQVGIIGGGPAGLLLSQLLYKAGISSIILERKSRDYVEGRIRAGVLEQVTVDQLTKADVADRLKREGLVHDGFDISVNGQLHYINLKELTGGHQVTVYGQTEVTKDLIDARIAADNNIIFEAEDVQIDDPTSDRPTIRYVKDFEARQFTCDFIAGCDGFHGVSRQAIPANILKAYEKVYPYAWLGILANTKPVSNELIYATSDRGFALFSMRSESVTRLYLQCPPDEDLDEWPDARIWEEAKRRLGGYIAQTMETGPSIEKSVTPMRSFVSEPMRYGNLFLAGDAAHIVPPTGAKGLNLAASDVALLSHAFVSYYDKGRTDLLDGYSQTCLKRIWRAERFSMWMTNMLHKHHADDSFDEKMQQAELDYLLNFEAGRRTIAENYVGLPIELN